MFPLKDDAPRLSTPFVTYFLLAANIAVFLFELSIQTAGGQPALNRFILEFGVVPARIPILLLNGGAVPHALVAHLGVRDVTLLSAFLPFLTSMFLHASWIHLIGNMWALYIFGDNVEDHFGHGLYLFVYLLTGIFGGLFHSFITLTFNISPTIPSVGASGAIAGIMGAYFVLFPSARVLTWVPLLFVFFLWLPAWVVLGYWFIVEFLSGAATAIAATSHTVPGGGVAFGAHVGGFLAGIFLVKLLPSRPGRYRFYGR